MTKNTSIHIGQLMQSSGVSFGTSGVRGLVSAMTDELCFAYTLAFAQTLNIAPGARVAIAMDLRPSSPTIAAACHAALSFAGVETVFCGALPTPALAFYAEQQKMPGIMITGSHIPFDRNGIKFYSAEGEITKAHEQTISTAQVHLPNVDFSQPLPSVNLAAKEFYLSRYRNYFAPNCLAGLSLAIYEHSSVARDLIKTLLIDLGANVISLGRTDEFVPIDTEAVAKVDVERAKKWANEYQFDAIISTDGDADRPLLGDETGQWMRGDIVGLLTAQFLGIDAIATPVSCNTAIEASDCFKEIKRTRIGSPYVIEAMQALMKNSAIKIAGFEANGGFLLGSTLNSSNGQLAALCTRDAVLPMLAVIALAKQKKCKLSALTMALPARLTASDRIQNFPTENSRTILQKLAAQPISIKELLGDLCGELANIDQTDGLRMTFKSGDIVHFRPSGNAPELRCYAEAADQTRADTLVAESLLRIKTFLSNA